VPRRLNGALDQHRHLPDRLTLRRHRAVASRRETKVSWTQLLHPGHDNEGRTSVAPPRIDLLPAVRCGDRRDLECGEGTLGVPEFSPRNWPRRHEPRRLPYRRHHTGQPTEPHDRRPRERTADTSRPGAFASGRSRVDVFEAAAALRPPPPPALRASHAAGAPTVRGVRLDA
jgi:hypothetical protein